MNIRLAIADKNEEYINKILNVLEEYEDLNISTYTDKNSLEKSLLERTFDILLFDVSVCEGQMPLGKASLSIMLLDETEYVPVGYKNFPKIKKYQRISNIFKKILEYYADICGDIGILSDQKKTKTVAFYSPIGGAGKTTMALTAAARLAMTGYKTCYINLEDIASEDCYLPQTGEKGMSEMLGCLGTGTNFKMKLQGLLQTKTDNLFYLNHFDSPNDIYELEPEETTELIHSFLRTGLFDYLILDMGTSMDEKTLKVFEAADQVVIVEKSDAIAVGKLEIFFRQAHIMQEHERKMCGLLNFDIGRSGAELTHIPEIGRISLLQNPDAAQLITMLSESEGSDFVKALL